MHLLVTDSLCISPLDCASPGLFLVQQAVGECRAEVSARIELSNAAERPQPAVVRLRIADGERTVYEAEKEIVVAPHATAQQERIDFVLEHPRLWNGTADPFLYRAEATLWRDGAEVDRVEQPLGLRYFTVDPELGFLLNGKHLPLHGVCRHQEWAEAGNALRAEHHEEDVRLMVEMGANAVRLAHYPQSEYIYDLMDRCGMIVWAEKIGRASCRERV